MSTMIRPALSLLVLMTLVTGVAYPLVVTGVAHVAFPDQANGSLVHDAEGKVRGSSLIAQDFVGDAWFHPRPSAGAFATVSSSASNLAPSNPALATPGDRRRQQAASSRARPGAAGAADHLRQRPRSALATGGNCLSTGACRGSTQPAGSDRAATARCAHRTAAGGAAGGECAGAEHGT